MVQHCFHPSFTIKTLRFKKIKSLTQVKQFIFCPSQVLHPVPGSEAKTLTHYGPLCVPMAGVEVGYQITPVGHCNLGSPLISFLLPLP